MRSRSKAQPLARPRVSRRVSGAHFQTLSAAVRAVSGAHFQTLSDVAPWLGGMGAQKGQLTCHGQQWPMARQCGR